MKLLYTRNKHYFSKRNFNIKFVGCRSSYLPYGNCWIRDDSDIHCNFNRYSKCTHPTTYPNYFIELIY